MIAVWIVLGILVYSGGLAVGMYFSGKHNESPNLGPDPTVILAIFWPICLVPYLFGSWAYRRGVAARKKETA